MFIMKKWQKRLIKLKNKGGNEEKMTNNTNIISSNFIITNRDLINKFGVNSAKMLGELYGRRNYFRERNELRFGYFLWQKR